MLFLLPAANTNLIVIFPLKFFSSNHLCDARKQTNILMFPREAEEEGDSWILIPPDAFSFISSCLAPFLFFLSSNDQVLHS